MHAEAIEQLQQQREREKQAERGQLQQQVDELIRLRGEVKRLNNVVLTNSAQSGKFFEVMRTSLLRCADTHETNSCLRHTMYHMLQAQLYTDSDCFQHLSVPECCVAICASAGISSQQAFS